MSNEENELALPWQGYKSRLYDRDCINLSASDREWIGILVNDTARTKRRAAFILRAANHHHALMKALKEARCWTRNSATGCTPAERGAQCETATEMLAMVDAAIAAAEAK